MMCLSFSHNWPSAYNPRSSGKFASPCKQEISEIRLLHTIGRFEMNLVCAINNSCTIWHQSEKTKNSQTLQLTKNSFLYKLLSENFKQRRPGDFLIQAGSQAKPTSICAFDGVLGRFKACLPKSSRFESTLRTFLNLYLGEYINSASWFSFMKFDDSMHYGNISSINVEHHNFSCPEWCSSSVQK